MGEKKHVLAIDLGHGETSAAAADILKGLPATNIDAPKDYDILPGKTVIPTAYARLEDRRELIGDEAIQNSGIAAQLAICFKKKPGLMDQTDKLLIQSYFKNVVHSIIISNNITSIKDYQIVVGCPSGWDVNDREQYEKILTASLEEDFGSDMKVEVIKESKAAIVHAVKREKHRMAHGVINDGILIIDFGSSTTDLTYMRGIDQPINIGFELGASKIEKGIFEHGLRSNPNLENALSNIQNRKVIEGRIEFICRKAKEDYFSSSDKTNPVSSALYKINSNAYYDQDVNKALMDSVLNQPTHIDARDVDECIIKHHISFAGKELKKSWKGFCKDIMQEVKTALEKEDRSIGAVIVTGGASRMDFIHEYGKEIFGADKFLPDTDPSRCISRGLALSCRADIRSSGMKEKVFKGVKDILNAKYDELIKPLSEKICDYVFSAVIKPKLMDWRDGQYSTLDSMTKAINKEAEGLKNSASINKLVREQLAVWLKNNSGSITTKVNTLFAEEYGPNIASNKVDIAGSLYNNVQAANNADVNFKAKEYVNFDVAADISEVIANIVGFIVAAIVGFIVSYIIVLIGLLIIGFIVGLTGFGLPVALWIASNAFWIAAAIAFAGGDIYEEIGEKFGEGTASVIKKMVGDPETKEFSLDKRKKYYNEIMKKESDIKKNMYSTIEAQLKKDEEMKNKFINSMDAVLKQSIELAMRYASLEL